jgi:hypothetical protein
MNTERNSLIGRLPGDTLDNIRDALAVVATVVNVPGDSWLLRADVGLVKLLAEIDAALESLAESVGNSPTMGKKP